MQKIIGRELEVQKLQALWARPRSEFVAVYGRRRVGKTFLVRNALWGKVTFHVTGLASAPMAQQLGSFHAELVKRSQGEGVWPPPKDWFSAFRQLMEWLERRPESEKKVVFLDELPWLDTRNSGFLSALEHFWNHWASARNDILLIVCGSAAAWMLNNVIRNRGGLHNRITERIRIEPFTLRECERYFREKNAIFDRYQLLQLYMVFGGIPFYLDRIDPALSAAQNINQLCFGGEVFFREEYDNLYASLFSKCERHTAVIEALARKGMGLTREEILKLTHLPDAGSTTRILTELEESHFIRAYRPFGKTTRNRLFQLVDPYSLFYLKFIRNADPDDDQYWLNLGDHPTFRAWSGYAFEMVCLHHIREIKEALGIAGVQTSVSAWRSKEAQIDLVIDRRDHVINLCEMKFSLHPVLIDKGYAETLQRKVERFAAHTQTKKALALTLITTYGLAPGPHAAVVRKTLTMDALFGDR
ncbi:MAG: ATP-binding protein [Saprospiraceae bacterium]|nr:ATP-binding protein [Saprospiraceae bacterium]MDW8230937.1 ATP-binding protein [Saprospiraceae bacterium]